MGYRRYDPDVKREAARMVVEEGFGIRDVERNLGITCGVLKGWVQKHREHQDAAFVGRVAPGSPKAELKRLRKENERLSKALHVSARRINEIVLGKRAITADTALRLAKGLGRTPQYWMGLQLAQAQEALGERLEREIRPISRERQGGIRRQRNDSAGKRNVALLLE